MKVIWRKDKSQDVCSGKKLRKFNSGDSSDVSHQSSLKTLSVMKGSTNFFMNNQNKQPDVPKQACGELKDAESVDAECLVCRVCGRETDLRALDDSNSGEACDLLIFKCFGVKVKNPSWKICEQCAQLIRSSYKFKELVCNALEPFDGELSVSSSIECESIEEVKLNMADNVTETHRFVRRVSLKKKPAAKKDDRITKKTFVVCTVCRQKYPMLSADVSTFVCCRCKITTNSERSIACSKCRALVPSRNMREHLEMHAKTDLKGRCRQVLVSKTKLRSLSKKPSKAHTSNGVPNKQRDQLKLPCKHCPKRFPYSLTLMEHMRSAHADYTSRNSFVCKICGKDLKEKVFLDRHMRTHEKTKFFECKVCGKIFKTSVAHKRHREIHQSVAN